MSKQRHLLIAAFWLLALALPAQSSLTLENALGLEFSSDASSHTEMNRLAWEQRLSPHWDLRLASNLRSTGLYVSGDPQKLWHHGELAVTGGNGVWELEAGYRNLFFGSPDTLGLYPDWKPFVAQERTLQHQATLIAGYKTPFLTASSHAQFKYLRYRPWELDLNTFELVPGPREGVGDVYYGLGLQTPPVGGISAHLALDRHQALSTEIYGLDQFNGGLDAEYRLGTYGWFSGSVNWTWRQGEGVPDQKRHLLQSTLRYQQRFTPDLAGFVYLVNNSCLDAGFNGLYLVSNYLRAQLKYSLPTDPSTSSYLLAGGKFSPENSASALFAETELRVWKSVYAGGGVNFQPGRQFTLSGKLGYFFNPTSELRLLYSHRANTLLNYSSDFIGLGSSLHW